MKIRHGFVSNSSSSSFIIVSKQEQDQYEIPSVMGLSRKIKIPETFQGEVQFGWQQEKYNTFSDRLNWAALGAMYKKGDEKQKKYRKEYYEGLKCTDKWELMLIDVLKKDFKVDDVIINFSEDDYDAYIDHQSSPYDRPENFRFFKSKKALRHWLYSDSVICCQNDNDEFYWDENGNPMGEKDED